MTNQGSKLIWGGQVTTVGAILFLLIVAALQILHPEISPSKNLISELALHRFGSAMFIAFLALAGSFAGLQVAVSQVGATRSLQTSLLCANAGFLASGMVTLDMSVPLHLVSVVLAFGSALIAMYLFPTEAGKASSIAPRTVSWGLGTGVGLGVALMRFSVGGGERISAILLVCWLVIAGWRIGSIAA